MRLAGAGPYSEGSDTGKRLVRYGLFIGVLTFLICVPVLISRAQFRNHRLTSLTNDSFSYLAGSLSILETGKYWTFSDSWSLHFPPGTSLVFAAASRLSGKPPEDLIGTVQAVALLTTCLALGVAAMLTLRSFSLSWLCVSAAVMNTEILAWHSRFVSDPWAFVLANCCLVCLTLFLRNERTKTEALYAAAGCAGLAIMVRWAMVFLIPLVLLSALLGSRRRFLSFAGAGAVLAGPLVFSILATRPGAPLEAWTYSGGNRGLLTFTMFGVLRINSCQQVLLAVSRR